MDAAFDVVVVGARCAGSPLAALLAREGLSVAVVDRAEFPSDTISTHIFQNEGVRVLERLGVLDEVLSSGAPWLERNRLRVEGLRIDAAIPCRADDPGPWLCVRRPLLDTVLVDAARRAGADVRTGTTVVGLVEEDGRVSGVSVRGQAGDKVLRAPLVVGADGRASVVARSTGARGYNLIPSQRFGLWTYYEDADRSPGGSLFTQRWDDELVLAAPADSGLFLVIVMPPVERLADWRSDPERFFDDHVARCEPVADVVADARRVGRLQAMLRWTGYFRESAGPGWVLVGDAGHFKDPTPGQGISDALRQADRLAPAIVDGLGGASSLDDAMAAWWRWRDDDAAEMAWFAGDLGRAGPVPPVLVEILAELVGNGEVNSFLDVFNHRAKPSDVLTPSRLAAATGRLLKRREHKRSHILRQTKDMVAEDLRRQRLDKHPAYAESGANLGAATEPTDGVVQEA